MAEFFQKVLEKLTENQSNLKKNKVEQGKSWQFRLKWPLRRAAAPRPKFSAILDELC
jgi:hypothetical protein